MNKKRGLLIAEKKSVSDDIQKVYEEIKNEYPYELDFAFCAGHLIEFCSPDEYPDKDWKVWSKENLPLVPDFWRKKIIPSKQSVFAALKKIYEEGNYDFIVNAGDAGREGQLVQMWVYEALDVQCPIYRYWANDMSAKTIKEALYNLKPNDDFQGLTNAAKLRAYLDWMCGMNYSRAASISLDRKINVGRVMSPTLAMIVNREKEIESFVPETYYEIGVTFEYKDETFSGKLLNISSPDKVSSRFSEREYLESIGSLTSGVVTKVEKEEKVQSAPSLYNLTSLQKDCSSKYGMSPKATSKVAQSLYEKHLLSYPRTESKCLSVAQANDVPDILSVLYDIPALYSGVKLITEKDVSRVSSNKKYFDDGKVSDHPALTPTREKANFEELTEQEKNVYLLVAKRFASIFLPPKKTLSVVVLINCNGYTFRATKSSVLDKGYTVLYKESDDTTTNPLQDIQKNDTVSLTEQEILVKETNPPKRYTHATILSAMETAGKTLNDEELEKALRECSGLGTPATRADILEKLVSDGYVSYLQGSLYPTVAGTDLVTALEGQQIISAELTANWEKILKCVELNLYPPDVIYSKIVESVTQNTSQLLDLNSLGPLERKVIARCIKCNGNVYESKKVYFCENVLSDENPCDFKLYRSIGGATISPSEFKNMCDGHISKMYHFNFENGKKSSGRLIIRNGQYEFAQKTIAPCPKCGRNVISGAKSFYCEGVSKALGGVCDFSMYNKIGTTPIPDDIATEVLTKGISQNSITVSFGKGKKSSGKVVINSEKPQFFSLYVEKPPVTSICKCPYCQGGEITLNGRMYVCSNSNPKKALCNFRIWDSVFESPVEPDNLMKMMQNETVLLPFKSKDNRYTYNKKVILSYNPGKNRYEYIIEKKH